MFVRTKEERVEGGCVDRQTRIVPQSTEIPESNLVVILEERAGGEGRRHLPRGDVNRCIGACRRGVLGIPEQCQFVWDGCPCNIHNRIGSSKHGDCPGGKYGTVWSQRINYWP